MLVAGAAKAGKRLPTLGVDAEIRLGSAADRAALAEDLAGAVQSLAARYHDESTPGGRWYRIVAFAHPRPGSEEKLRHDR